MYLSTIKEKALDDISYGIIRMVLVWMQKGKSNYNNLENEFDEYKSYAKK